MDGNGINMFGIVHQYILGSILNCVVRSYSRRKIIVDTKYCYTTNEIVVKNDTVNNSIISILTAGFAGFPVITCCA